MVSAAEMTTGFVLTDANGKATLDVAGVPTSGDAAELQEYLYSLGLSDLRVRMVDTNGTVAGGEALVITGKNGESCTINKDNVWYAGVNFADGLSEHEVALLQAKLSGPADSFEKNTLNHQIATIADKMNEVYAEMMALATFMVTGSVTGLSDSVKKLLKVGDQTIQSLLDTSNCSIVINGTSAPLTMTIEDVYDAIMTQTTEGSTINMDKGGSDGEKKYTIKTNLQGGSDGNTYEITFPADSPFELQTYSDSSETQKGGETYDVKDLELCVTDVESTLTSVGTMYQIQQKLSLSKETVSTLSAVGKAMVDPITTAQQSFQRALTS